ncbi:MAG: hypothetical protein PUE58_05670 [Lachnospiraceae bacterium]|nr:hypothetical protein [Lachnospiraceae bacterium]
MESQNLQKQNHKIQTIQPEELLTRKPQDGKPQGSDRTELKSKRRQAALFLLILFLLLYIPGKLLTPKLMNNLDLSSGRNGVIPKILSEPADSVDLLIVGDSESYTSIDPRLMFKNYGIRCYAAGQAGATIGESYEILEKSLTRQRPRIVLYESNSLFRTQPDTNRTGAVITNTMEKIFPLIKYHSAWKSPFIAKFVKTYKGFRIDTRIKPYRGGNYMRKDMASDDNAEIGWNNIRYLEEMKALAEANGAVFIMYSAPSPKNYDYSKHIALTKLAEKEGIQYVDMNAHNKELKMNWAKDTRDRGDHLNVYGARRATRFMGRYLSEKNDLMALRSGDMKTSSISGARKADTVPGRK